MTAVAWRRVPPVVPVQDAPAWRSAWDAARQAGASSPTEALAHLLEQVLGARCVALTDSGTSALRVGVGMATRSLGLEDTTLIVAIPGFGCVDVATAVQGVGGTAIPYDLVPDTLAPDAASVERALEAGARVVIATHYFGMRLPLEALRALCRRYDAVLIEDAAQGAGVLRTPEFPVVGDLVVLSFGRGKGLGGAGGGALLASASSRCLADGGAAATWPNEATHSTVDSWRTLASAAAAFALAFPAVYALPAAVPFLHLGEMRYHPPQSPRPIDPVSAAFARRGVERAEEAIGARTVVALRLQRAAATGARGLAVTAPRRNAWLRFPLRIHTPRQHLPHRLGVLHPYPIVVPEQSGTRAIMKSVDPLPGARSLATALVTLPVHHRLAERDIASLESWLTTSA